ncbi:MAG TPA: hypothetical protein P5572_06520 [Phycisphaerae bacterium]|nr:hypothetical protein [Phycisphaerae bacterium]
MRAPQPTCSWYTLPIVCTLTAVCLLAAAPAHAIDPRPAGTFALWSGEVWGELQVTPAITKSVNSVTARAIVRGGPAGNPSWHCSQYSGWVAAGTGTIAIVVPEDWSFTSGPGYVRSIGGRAMIQESSAGDPPPYGWDDRVSDTCYCSVGSWGASGGCATREITPTFATAMQEEIVAPGASGQWVRISAEFYGWNGVAWNDSATAYVYVIDETAELLDTDDDGIGDDWEIAYFGDLTTATATSSYPDGDGLDDLTEFQYWKNDSRDGDGSQYDPTAKNATGSGSTPVGAVGCGAAGPATLLLAPLSLTLLAAATRRRRR